MSEETYLDPDVYPWTNVILSVVASAGVGLQREVPGYRPHPEGGAVVDWDVLLGSWLSSTEKASVRIARGISGIERHGGFPPQVGHVVLGAVQSLAGSGTWEDQMGETVDETLARMPERLAAWEEQLEADARAGANLAATLAATGLVETVGWAGELLRVLTIPEHRDDFVRWASDAVGIVQLMQALVNRYGPDYIAEALSGTGVKVVTS